VYANLFDAQGAWGLALYDKFILSHFFQNLQRWLSAIRYPLSAGPAFQAEKVRTLEGKNLRTRISKEGQQPTPFLLLTFLPSYLPTLLPSYRHTVMPSYPPTDLAEPLHLIDSGHSCD